MSADVEGGLAEPEADGFSCGLGDRLGEGWKRKNQMDLQISGTGEMMRPRLEPQLRQVWKAG